MKSIQIIDIKSYLPNNKIENKKLEEKYHLSENWIKKRSGILERYQVTNETICELAIEVAKKVRIDVLKRIGIFVATTSTNCLMPGISFEIQKEIRSKKAICLDILGGCSGFINAFDIARKYLLLDEIDYALVIGVEVLSKFLNKEDKDTSVLLGDGAGAILLGSAEKQKKYMVHIQSDGSRGELLTCYANEHIKMDGKGIYKYAVGETVTNIQELLIKSGEKIENIRFIIPHQSNMKILTSIAQRLKIPQEKIYHNIERVGNTFCASIPIAMEEMRKNKILQDGDKIIMLRIWWRIEFRKYFIGGII